VVVRIPSFALHRFFMTSLKITFDFSKNKATQLQQLLIILRNLSADITTLNMSYNGLHYLTYPELLEFGTAIPPQIKKLAFNNNHLGVKLFYLIQNLPTTISELDLSHNQLIGFDERKYNIFANSFSENIRVLHLDYQDFSFEKICLPDELHTLYLSRVDILKNNYLKRQLFIHKLGLDTEQVILDKTFWMISMPDYPSWDMVPDFIETMIINLGALQLHEIPRLLERLPLHIHNLYLDSFFNIELHFELQAMRPAEKIDFFNRFPAHLQTIFWGGKPIFCPQTRRLLEQPVRITSSPFGLFRQDSVDLGNEDKALNLA